MGGVATEKLRTPRFVEEMWLVLFGVLKADEIFSIQVERRFRNKIGSLPSSGF